MIIYLEKDNFFFKSEKQVYQPFGISSSEPVPMNFASQLLNAVISKMYVNLQLNECCLKQQEEKFKSHQF